jgi:hypothetical protein
MQVPSCHVSKNEEASQHPVPFRLFQQERRLVDEPVVLEIAAKIRAIRVLPDNGLTDDSVDISIA